MKTYYPYPANDNKHKYYIITNTGKKIYFGAFGYEHYTDGHLDEARRQRYMMRHRKRENWNNPDTAGYYSKWFLWSFPTYKESYKKIKNDVFKKGLITKKQYDEYVF